ncbi:hypothetical protein ABZ079_27045 [Streptomyces sp. NPDC006314]|uniref:hypothetical protein n=1 Tax=Streptomyces sp. NPDC006314 TaxID=3154475 RepID=UPI0033A21FA1
MDALFGPVDATGHAVDAPACAPTAAARDGALALAVGLGADRAFETGRPVAVKELMPERWRR